MFAKVRQEERGQPIATVIGDDCQLEGRIVVQGHLRIEGRFQGEIEAGGTVILGDKAQVEGKIKAKDLLVAGRLEGDVELTGKLEIAAKGILRGSAKMKLLIVEEGGQFHGQCEMLGQPPAGGKTELPASKKG